MKHKPRDDLKEYEDRWEWAGTREAARREPFSVVRNLEGDWEVKRLSGPLPMPFVWKRIRAGRGETRVSPRAGRRYEPFFEPRMPFELEQREGYVALIYHPPLSFLIDELRAEADGSWLGQAKVAGFRYAWFRMTPLRSS
jgi:hypothetical protein